MKLSNKIVPFIGCLFLIAVFIECAWIGFSIDNAVRVLMETMVGTIWVAFGIVVPTDKARLELKAIKEELKVTESLLNERQRLLDAIPECPETVLTWQEEQRIIDVFNAKQAQEDFSVAVSYDEITAKNYSLSAGQYFDVKIEYVDITPEQFAARMKGFSENLDSLFSRSRELEVEIKKQLAGLNYGN